jgi:hypothetical protein
MRPNRATWPAAPRRVPRPSRSYSLIRPSTSARTVAKGTIRSVPDDSAAPAARRDESMNVRPRASEPSLTPAQNLGLACQRAPVHRAVGSVAPCNMMPVPSLGGLVIVPAGLGTIGGRRMT